MATISTVVGRWDRRRLAWIAPVVVTGAIVAGVTLGTAASSGATPTLPTRTAAQLLVAVQTKATTVFSGKVHESVNLGLPSLPGAQAPASLSWQSFLTGSHNAKVWSYGMSKQRVALVGELSEADVTHNGRNVWTYTSGTNTVTHTVLPARDAAKHTDTGAAKYSPAEAADRLLKAITPSTSVTVDTARMVAGRATYTLVLKPKDANSTVRQVRIAIDAKKYLPLQVQVFGASSTPAIQVGFTSISYAKPSASVFNFQRPKGSTLSTNPLGSEDRHFARHSRHHTEPSVTPAGGATLSHGSSKVIGSGWTAVVELSGTDQATSALNNGTLQQLTTSVGSSGTRLLHTALLNAVLLPDGRVFAGAVTPAQLERVAAATPR